MICRRGFLKAGGAIAASLLAKHATGEEDVAAPTPGFRTITYNVYGCQGWPKKRQNRARLAAARPQMPTRLALELALYEPDVVTLVEAPDEGAVAAIAEQLNMGHAYYTSPEGFPGAVLTHHKIVESANCPLKGGASRPADLLTRHFGRAVIATSRGELTVYSAHLHPINKETRMREIAAILATMEEDLGSNRSVLLQGDLNHTPDFPGYQHWIRAGLIDAFAAKGIGEKGTSHSAKPSRRIDYIWLHGPLARGLAECRVLFEGAFRLHVDDPEAFALSDHLPVMATFA